MQGKQSAVTANSWWCCECVSGETSPISPCLSFFPSSTAPSQGRWRGDVWTHSWSHDSAEQMDKEGGRRTEVYTVSHRTKDWECDVKILRRACWEVICSQLWTAACLTMHLPDRRSAKTARFKEHFHCIPESRPDPAIKVFAFPFSCSKPIGSMRRLGKTFSPNDVEEVFFF